MAEGLVPHLDDELRRLVSGPDDAWFQPAWDLLAQYHEHGVTQDEMYEFLERVRGEVGADDQAEDRALDLMDLVRGWCAPKFRLWG